MTFSQYILVSTYNPIVITLLKFKKYVNVNAFLIILMKLK